MAINADQFMKDLEAAIDKINKSMENSADSIILAKERSTDKQIAKEETSTNKQIHNTDVATNKRIIVEEKSARKVEDLKEKEAEKRNKRQLETADAIARTISNVSSSVTSTFRSMLETYTKEQQKLAFNLLGSGMSYDTVQSALKALSTNTIIRQTDVYNKLTEMVSRGITANVAQRAFLQTTAEQVGFNFDMTSSTLNRLIQLQNEDLTESRIAQMAGLNKFLEQNYQNSQYIHEGFSRVSDALFEMQTMMSSSMAMATEKTIQTYLGSFASAGGSNETVNKLADAINAIGSGNFEGLGDMQNLLIMAASRANLSYADLLTGGLDQTETESLLQAVISYMSSMQDVAGGSNVALSAMARMFGLNISDIKAAQNVNLGAANAGYNASIAQFLGDIASNTNGSVQLSNWMNNRYSNLALNSWLGMEGLGLTGFDIFSDLSSVIGKAVGSIETSSGILDIFGGKNVTEAAKAIAAATIGNAPGLAILAGALGPAIGNIFTSGNISAFMKGDQDFGSMLQGILTGAVGTNGMDAATVAFLQAYRDIGNYNNINTLKTQGEWNATQTGEGTSAGASNKEEDLSPLNTGTIIEGYGETQETKTLDDLYSLLADDFPTTTFTTATRLVEAGNEVLIGDAKTTQYITDMLTLTAVSAENILMLLENVYAGGTRSLTDIGAIGLENTWGDWSGTSRP